MRNLVLTKIAFSFASENYSDKSMDFKDNPSQLIQFDNLMTNQTRIKPVWWVNLNHENELLFLRRNFPFFHCFKWSRDGL